MNIIGDDKSIMNVLFEKYSASGMLLDAGEFRSAFREFWPRCSRRFLKLETLFTYHESDNPSWTAFRAGQPDRAIELLNEGLSRSLPFYERVRALGIDSHRVRPVRWPLTPYLEWEFLSYEVSIRNGQRVSLYPAEAVSVDVSDFILFDDDACLIHRYSEQGEHEGGVLVETKQVIDALADLHGRLAGLGRPFHDAIMFGDDMHWHPRMPVTAPSPSPCHT